MDSVHLVQSLCPYSSSLFFITLFALFTSTLYTSLSGLESETLHTLFILGNEIIAFSGLLAIEKKTLVTLFLLFQAHTAWFWFFLFV